MKFEAQTTFGGWFQFEPVLQQIGDFCRLAIANLLGEGELDLAGDECDGERPFVLTERGGTEVMRIYLVKFVGHINVMDMNGNRWDMELSQVKLNDLVGLYEFMNKYFNEQLDFQKAITVPDGYEICSRCENTKHRFLIHKNVNDENVCESCWNNAVDKAEDEPDSYQEHRKAHGFDEDETPAMTVRDLVQKYPELYNFYYTWRNTDRPDLEKDIVDVLRERGLKFKDPEDISLGYNDIKGYLNCELVEI